MGGSDDTKLAQVIKSMEDAERLQAYLDQIREWAEKRKMSFNVKNCKVVQPERKDVLFLESVWLDTRKNFFTIRVVSKWNQISENVKKKKSINAFKNSYDEWRKQQQQQT